jgi:hypothetical protein
MTAFLRAWLLIIAVIASLDALVAAFGHLHSDCYLYLLGAVLALGCVVALDYVDAERDKRISAERDRTWARRDREAGH